MMPMREMGVMPCRFVMTLFVMLGGFFMVLRSPSGARASVYG